MSDESEALAARFDARRKAAYHKHWWDGDVNHEALLEADRADLKETLDGKPWWES